MGKWTWTESNRPCCSESAIAIRPCRGLTLMSRGASLGFDHVGASTNNQVPRPCVLVYTHVYASLRPCVLDISRHTIGVASECASVSVEKYIIVA